MTRNENFSFHSSSDRWAWRMQKNFHLLILMNRNSMQTRLYLFCIRSVEKEWQVEFLDFFRVYEPKMVRSWQRELWRAFVRLALTAGCYWHVKALLLCSFSILLYVLHLLSIIIMVEMVRASASTGSESSRVVRNPEWSKALKLQSFLRSCIFLLSFFRGRTNFKAQEHSSSMSIRQFQMLLAQSNQGILRFLLRS